MKSKGTLFLVVLLTSAVYSQKVNPLIMNPTKQIIGIDSIINQMSLSAKTQIDLQDKNIEHPQYVVKATYFDKTPPLRSMKVIKPGSIKRNWKEDEDENVVPNKNLPINNNQNGLPLGIDPVLQMKYNMKSDLLKSATTIMNFDGLARIQGVYPPDTQGDVGSDVYMQITNCSFAVYSKSTGALLYGPADNSTMWAGFNGAWSTTNDGDGVILYDEHAQRWIFSQFSLPTYPKGPFYETIAISETSDPLGSWYRYAFQFTDMPDYPKFGVWSDGYYMSCNTFASSSGSFLGGSAAVFERDQMLVGNPNARMVFFGPNSLRGGELPSDWDGPTAPPSGAPNYFTLLYSSIQLKVWALHVDWTNTSNSTFTNVSTLTVASYNTTLCSGTSLCIPQPTTSQKLDALPDRIMYRLQYRNFGTYQAMVTNHTVNANGSGLAGIRWYEFRNTGSGWTVYQQGTYAPDTKSRWMGSIAMNGNGDIALGFSVSSASQYPSISYTGRSTTTPLGQMSVPESQLIAGTGYQSGSAGRWGDYSMMSVDPSDDNTFWYTQEYIQTSGTANWRTRIASFQLSSPTCTPVSVTSNPSNPPTVCEGTNSSTLIVSVSGTPNFNYQWQINNSGTWTNLTTGGVYGNTSVTTNSISNSNSLIITNADATYNQKQYRCLISNCSGANSATSGSATLTVNSKAAVSVSIDANSTGPICSGTSVTFTATPTNGGTAPAYVWKVNGTPVSTSGSTYTYAPANNDVVTCVLTSSLTCSSGSPATSNAITMTVNNTLPVSVSIGASANPVCSGTSVTFTATPTNGGTVPAYVWKVNGTPVSTSASAYTYAPANNDVVTCVLTSSLTCSSGSPATSNAITMTVNNTLPVIVSIGASANPVCSGTSVTFTATPTNGGIAPAFVWKVNGTPVSTSGSTYTYAPANNDVVTCVLTSSLTCSSGSPATSNAITMTVNNTLAVSVSIGASANPVCSGTSVTFTATPTNGGTAPAFVWKVNGTPVSTSGSTYTYAPANNDVVTCVLTSSLTCSSGSPATSNAITMTVNNTLPVSVSIGASANPVCSGTSVTFTATPTNGGTAPAFVWMVNGTPVSTSGSTYTYAPANNDVVTCVLTSSLTCSSGSPATSNAITMTVNNTLPVSVSIGASANPVCSGTGVTFTATPTNGGTAPAYVWKVNGTPVSTSGSTYTYAPANNDVVTCVLTSSLTCSSGSPATSNAITMTVNNTLAVSVSIGASANPVCSGTSVTYTATPTNGGTAPAYVWKVNGTPVSTSGSTYTYAPANNDIVTCVLTSSLTCSSGSPATSNPITMTVNNTLAVSVSIGASANPVCSGTSVTYTATPTNGGTAPAFVWKVNGTPVSTSGSTYTYAPANNDVVTCVLTSSLTCSSGSPATSNAITMTVNNTLAVSVSIGASANPVCSGTSVTFTATPTNGGTAPAYVWKVNGTPVSTSGSTYSYAPANNDIVTCLLTLSLTCSSGSPATSNAITMTVNNTLAVSVSIGASANPVCLGTSVTYTATPTNGGTAPSYQWKVNGTNIDANGSVLDYAPANNDVVTCVLTSSLPCSSGSPAISNAITMTVNASPTASITPIGQITFCTTGIVTLYANTGTGLTYQWQKNGANISGATKSTYVASSAGNFNVIVKNSGGCSAKSNIVTVIFNTAPSATITAQGPTTFCNGGSVVLNANQGIGYIYQWRKGSSNISGATNSSYSANSSGNYRVIVKSGSCSTTSSLVTVTVNSVPTATVTPAGPINLSTGGTTTLTANRSTSVIYQWQKNSVNISGATTRTYVVSTAGIYRVTETNGNGCTGFSNAVTVTVNGQSKLADNSNEQTPSISNNHPNPFSNFTQIDYNLPEAGQVTLKVYNMVGQEIATLVNSSQDKGNYKVDFNGDKLKQGVYIYRFTVENNNNIYTKSKMMILNR